MRTGTPRPANARLTARVTVSMIPRRFC